MTKEWSSQSMILENLPRILQLSPFQQGKHSHRERTHLPWTQLSVFLLMWGLKKSAIKYLIFPNNLEIYYIKQYCIIIGVSRVTVKGNHYNNENFLCENIKFTAYCFDLVWFLIARYISSYIPSGCMVLLWGMYM